MLCIRRNNIIDIDKVSMHTVPQAGQNRQLQNVEFEDHLNRHRRGMGEAGCRGRDQNEHHRRSDQKLLDGCNEHHRYQPGARRQASKGQAATLH